MNVEAYGIKAGHPADLVVLDCREEAAAVAEIVQPLFALKRGRRSFTRAQPTLHRPHQPAAPQCQSRPSSPCERSIATARVAASLNLVVGTRVRTGTEMAVLPDPSRLNL